MNFPMKTLLAAALFAGVAGVSAQSAQAMPLGLDPAVVTNADTLQAENVRWVCGIYRCRWAPNYYRWGPRPFFRPYGFYGRPYWRRPWRRW